jgi:hypothetical protein
MWQIGQRLPLARARFVPHISRMAELVIRRGLEEPDTSANFVPHKPARPEKSEGGKPFKVVSDYQPAGDQPTAIADLVAAVRDGERDAGAAGRHRLGQDLHDGQGDRGRRSARR